ncbi:MAG TPA: T9SS type A sorting domain-containing protein [Bacteroidota bacterium]|nr:T9SS type A sorting domain-containing protein [Bacteroidota bacterium]
MRKLLLYAAMCLIVSVTTVLAQSYQRVVVDVPRVDPGTITVDGKMDEGAWATAAHADLVTNTGFQMFTYPYYRAGLTEPEYNQLYARMLWSADTLYVFYHCSIFVNDSTGLYWDGKWKGDQLFISLSDRFGVDMEGWYDGNVYAAPNGPYHFLILGNKVTLNNGDTTNIPTEYRRFPTDTARVFNASDIAHWATVIDTATGLWNVEMAIYMPNAAADARIGFNIGGSTGSRKTAQDYNDAYAYYCWQPCVPDSPFAQPHGVVVPSYGSDPGFYNLANSDYWAILHLKPGAGDYPRVQVNVPQVDPTAITIDGNMNETAWSTAAHADLVTNTGFQMFTYPYYRSGLTEPEYNQLYGRMLWAKDTLYVFYHCSIFVNDSTGLYWGGKWKGDQLFISLSNRMGVGMEGWYDGNSYAAPDGPYHFWIFGSDVTLGGGDSTKIPTEYQRFPGDTVRVFHASDIARWAAKIDTTTGLWNLEMAIYNPMVNLGGRIGFNIGGSTGSRKTALEYNDAYAYYCWQPCVPDSPFAQPHDVIIPSYGADPGFYNLANSDYWPLLTFTSTGGTNAIAAGSGAGVPATFVLNQNYPNPFNPATVVSYEIPKAARVSLVVYNLLGQKLATLFDGAQAAGKHSVTWNASNFSTGIYFVRMKANDTMIGTRKMMLLK